MHKTLFVAVQFFGWILTVFITWAFRLLPIKISKMFFIKTMQYVLNYSIDWGWKHADYSNFLISFLFFIKTVLVEGKKIHKKKKKYEKFFNSRFWFVFFFFYHENFMENYYSHVKWFLYVIYLNIVCCINEFSI